MQKEWVLEVLCFICTPYVRASSSQRCTTRFPWNPLSTSKECRIWGDPPSAASLNFEILQDAYYLLESDLGKKVYILAAEYM